MFLSLLKERTTKCDEIATTWEVLQELDPFAADYARNMTIRFGLNPDRFACFQTVLTPAN